MEIKYHLEPPQTYQVSTCGIMVIYCHSEPLCEPKKLKLELKFQEFSKTKSFSAPDAVAALDCGFKFYPEWRPAIKEFLSNEGCPIIFTEFNQGDQVCVNISTICPISMDHTDIILCRGTIWLWLSPWARSRCLCPPGETPSAPGGQSGMKDYLVQSYSHFMHHNQSCFQQDFTFLV